jgi:signal peptidase I
MSPGTPAGSLGFARDVTASEIHVGDVVTVHTKGGTRVTHRVVDLTRHGDEATLRLKGDANTTPDADLYPVRTAMRLWFSVPRAGYAVAWLSHAPGSYLLALYVALMLLLVGRRRDSGAGGDHRRTSSRDDAVEPDAVPRAPGRRRRTRNVVAATAAAGLLATGIAVVGGWGTSTWASWTDTAAVSGTALATGTFPSPLAAPVVSCGALAKKSVTLTWTAVPGATSYDLYFPDGNTLALNQVATSYTLSGSAQMQGNFSVKARNATSVSAMSNSRQYDTGTGSGNGTCS